MSTSNLFCFILFSVVLFSKPLQRCNASNQCLEIFPWVTDDISTNSTILSSPENIFEFGFFTPDGKNWYLGIWYDDTSMKIVVWVANRDKPLHDSDASLLLASESNAMLLVQNGSIYWSTNSSSISSDLVRASPTNLCLSDSGNLILKPVDPLKPEWQSFEHPTDTFLPGMNANGTILISWSNQNTPLPGNFTLRLGQTSLSLSIKKIPTYWESSDLPDIVVNLLVDAKRVHRRLVMNVTGQVQLWEWDSSTGWSLKWFEPKDRCSLHNICGNFGSCNSYNRLLCKCLPGFTPVDADCWNAGDHSGGCSPKSHFCGRKPDEDMFLTLPMMKVDHDGISRNFAGQDCKTECHNDCNCIAYSINGTDSESSCKIWTSTSLTGLQEEYADGITLYVRTTPQSVVALTRDCDPCGTYSIPYPLSTASNCGDPSYLYFHCNNETGQVVFSAPGGNNFNVTLISQETQTFFIQVANASNCDQILKSTLMSNMQSSLFNMRNCNVISNQPLIETYQPFIEVEISWQPPAEPACNASSDCRDWPHTTCNAAKGGERRCLCAFNFDWDGSQMKCKTREKGPEGRMNENGREVKPVKILIACLAAALAIGLLGGMAFIFRKRRTTRDAGSVKLMGDDSEPIDLPFFDWETILSATNKFADENKLGTGGFGSVYRGCLPDRQKIAVKRLSSASLQGTEEFRTEVVLIAKLQHRNLVRLLGYCVKADEKILVYEYMPNGSLDSRLFDETLSLNLDWEKRFDIITGVARGLLYLHQDSRLRIIHRDLKPSNVLLDDDLNPKISDFGIARIVQGKQTESNTKTVVGTYGYMAPEYAYEGFFSIKSDVFSFGVVVLETISGRRNSRVFINEHGLSLLGHAWKLWNEDRGMELPELTLRNSCNISEVLRCIQIALLCIQEDPNDRPTMSTVVLMLSSENASLPPPKQPAFSTVKTVLETASSSSAVEISLNDMSFTGSTGGR